MKLSTKPISSPGRNDKFPPPLMRFLRSNAGSRSRGRSRSSPMFLRKKNTAIETQEPSSPKVTCMGQVRVRRSSKQSAAKRGRSSSSSSSASAAADGAPTNCRCRCWWVPIPNALFFHLFASKFKPGSCCQCQCQPVWPNWGFFRRRKVSKVTEALTKTELNFRGRTNDEYEHEHEEEHEERVNASAFVSSNSSSTPPRNALLLTRCRSAPYRSSSLACRFWGSPLRSEEKTGEEQGTEIENRESAEIEIPSEERGFISEQEGRKDPKLELKLRFFKELEDSLRERIMESEKVRELERREGAQGDSAARPLVLTRCKSEPARTAQKLVPEVNNFWKKRRLGFADTCSPHMVSD